MTKALEMMFEFRKDAPPTTEEFRQIGLALVKSFQELALEQPCETLTISVETDSRVHVQLFVGDRREFRGDSFFAIITYSLTDSKPDASCTLFKFLDGHRVSNGKESIMTSTFSETGWSSFAWEFDGFGEWECDHASELHALNQ